MELDQFQSENGFLLSSSLLNEALTHPSYKFVDETTLHYERLEILGDAVLGLVVMEDLLQNHPDLDPGGLTLRRSSQVKNSTLTQVAADLNLSSLIITAPKYELTDGDLANVMEALFGALYQEGGLHLAQKWYSKIKNRIMLYSPHVDHINPIGSLQEIAQQSKIPTPAYTVIRSGSDHLPHFEATVQISINNENFFATGSGTSKQKSREAAAIQLLSKIAKMSNVEL